MRRDQENIGSGGAGRDCVSSYIALFVLPAPICRGTMRVLKHTHLKNSLAHCQLARIPSGVQSKWQIVDRKESHPQHHGEIHTPLRLMIVLEALEAKTLLLLTAGREGSWMASRLCHLDCPRAFSSVGKATLSAVSQSCYVFPTCSCVLLLEEIPLGTEQLVRDSASP